MHAVVRTHDRLLLIIPAVFFAATLVQNWFDSHEPGEPITAASLGVLLISSALLGLPNLIAAAVMLIFRGSRLVVRTATGYAMACGILGVITSISVRLSVSSTAVLGYLWLLAGELGAVAAATLVVGFVIWYVSQRRTARRSIPVPQ
ncbi:hypothetical protein FOE78_13405 [Microlunatus elymi]|uniref:Uncharacterized protein n=1 Tax=Microlunatus elymi TaxID=2596828 RepID=A0A516Q0P0_9ACTN|nr:hypothetical protein [Microlunatus elymi]QDP96771.1 hypothetical protein FOE78_13405 [Microlunatus elymi]